LTVLLPHLARCAVVSRPAVGIALRTALGRSLLVAVPATVAGFFLARASLMILFGPGFDAATGILQVLLLAVFVNLIAGQYRTALVAAGCQRQDLAAVAASAVAHVAAKLILIPHFGAAGTACGTLLGEAVLMVTAMSLVRTTVRESRNGA
jgi:O-antigen/teichoic acid export membrane protein